MQNVDGLSEVLRTIRLQGSLFFAGEFTAPWCVRCSDPQELSPLVASSGEHVITFHLLTEGRAQIRLAGGQIHHLSAGDLVVCPRGEAHWFSNGYPERPVEGSRVLAAGLARTAKVVRFGGGGEVTRFVCGFVGCDPRLSEVLLAGLPPVLVVHRGSGETAWIADCVVHLAHSPASTDASNELIRTKLAEVLFLETIRLYVRDLPPEAKGWLAGTKDPFVGRALAVLHRAPRTPWTLETLGAQVGLSRSRLVERFQTYLGVSPMAYLARWRLTLASELLSAGLFHVSEVAQQVGYSSEAGFSRAFKREFGVSPAHYRRDLPLEVRSLPRTSDAPGDDDDQSRTRAG